MKVSLALVSLGLCAAPAFAQSLATVTIHSLNKTWAEEPKLGECINNWYSDVPIKEIEIEGHVPNVKCIFNDEHECTGQSLRLKEGDHKFKREFIVGSLACGV